jgi:hypothetical protein
VVSYANEALEGHPLDDEVPVRHGFHRQSALALAVVVLPDEQVLDAIADRVGQRVRGVFIDRVVVPLDAVIPPSFP